MFRDGVKQKSLRDVGTRYEHLWELSDAWEDGIIAIESRKHLGDEDKKKLAALKTGVELVSHILTSLSDYLDKKYQLGTQIDQIDLNYEMIPSTRGTPLNLVGKPLPPPEYSTEETITLGAL